MGDTSSFSTTISTRKIEKTRVASEGISDEYVDPALKNTREFTLRAHRVMSYVERFAWDLHRLREDSKKLLDVEVITDWDVRRVRLTSQYKRALPEEPEILAMWTLVRPICDKIGDHIDVYSVVNELKRYFLEDGKVPPYIESPLKEIADQFKLLVDQPLGNRTQRQNKVNPDESTYTELMRAYFYGEASHHDRKVRAGVRAHYVLQYQAAAPLVIDAVIITSALQTAIKALLPKEHNEWITAYESLKVDFNPEVVEGPFGTVFNLLQDLGPFPSPTQMTERFFSHIEEFKPTMDIDQPRMLFQHESGGGMVAVAIPDDLHYNLLAGRSMQITFAFGDTISATYEMLN